MKTALILGFSGSFGMAMTKALLEDNYQVVALIRNEEQKNLLTHQNLTFISGDIFNQALLEPLCKQSDIIVYGINMPYFQWQSKASLYLETVLSYCEGSSARFVFPGNIYAYDNIKDSKINENTQKKPTHFLGDVRLNMENQLLRASKNGLNVLIMRAGNYFGDHAPSAWLGFLIKQKSNQANSSATANPDAISNYAYLPDLAKTTIQLLATDLKNYEEFCFGGTNISFNQMKSLIEEQTQLSAKVSYFNWPMIQFLGLFINKMKHLKVTQYLFEQNITLDDSKITQQLHNHGVATDFIVALKKSNLIRF